MSAEIAEVAIPYAILALYDDNVEITADNILKILVAAKIEVEPIWAEVFARTYGDAAKVKALVESIGAGASSVAVAAPAAATSNAAAAPAAKEAPKKKEESEEEMGLGLFD